MGSQKSQDRTENQATERQLAHHATTLTVPRVRHQGALCTCWNRQPLNRRTGEGNGTPLQDSRLENPRDGEPGGLQSMGSRRGGHDGGTSLSLFTHWRRKWQPTPVFLPGESQGPGARWTAVYGVAQGRTRLNRLAAAATLRHGPLSWPWSWPQRPDLHVTAGASSQGTDSEPRPPGLLLRVKLHPGPSTPNWRVKGSRGHESPPSSQKERRGGAPRAHPVNPSSSPQPAPAPPHLCSEPALPLPSLTTLLPVLGLSLSTDLQ